MAVAAIILAGELERARDGFDSAGPRPLLTIGHSRWMHLVIEHCVQAGVSAVALCVTRLSQRLAEELDEWTGRIDLRVLVDSVPRGSAGCCRDAAELFDADAFVVIEGTVVPRQPVADVLLRHRQSEAAVTLAVTAQGDGRIRYATPVGVAVISVESLKQVSTIGFQDLKEGLIPRLLTNGWVSATFPVTRECPRIRDLGSYLYSQRLMLHDSIGSGVAVFDGWEAVPRPISAASSLWPGVEFVGPVLVGADAQIGAGAIVIGPCVIGPDCCIESGAVLSGSVMREHSRIGERGVVCHSLMLPGSVVLEDAEHDREILFGEE